MSRRAVALFAFGVSIAASSLLPVSSGPPEPAQPVPAPAAAVSAEDSQAFPPPPSLSPLVTQVLAAPSAVLGTDKRAASGL